MQVSPRRPLRWLGILILGSGLIYTVSSLLLYSTDGPWRQVGFPLLGPWRMPTFADLRWVTATSDCGIDLNAFYAGKLVGCDAFGRKGVGYPPMALWLFRLLGIKAAWTGIIGLITAMGFLASTAFYLLKINRNTAVSALVAGLLIWGFPIQLCFERMNIDILIYSLIILNCGLLSLRSAFLRGLGSLALSIATVGMKIYPVFGYFCLILLAAPLARVRDGIFRINRIDGLIILAGCAVGLISAAPVLTGGSSLSTSSLPAAEGGIGSHGLLAFGFINADLVQLYGLQPARALVRLNFMLKISSLIAGFWLTIALDLGATLRRYIAGLDAQEPNGRRARFILNTISSMTGIWLGCYLFTISYDYRLIFLIPMIGVLAQCRQPGGNPWQRRWGLCLVAMGLIPGLSTMLLSALPATSPSLRTTHEIIVEFMMMPLLASSAAALLSQLPGLAWPLRTGRPAPVPIPPDPDR
ncbi:MAG: hypothetical protein VKK62_01965 [Synechococcaceae cyanobacterium]|nr:hypothetical protein [Synechococcaceae cyanobacterium]